MKDANELLVAEGPQLFAQRWAQARTDASVAPHVTAAVKATTAVVTLPVPLPASSPPDPAAKEENPSSLLTHDASGVYVLVNLLVDLSYTVLDPRIRY